MNMRWILPPVLRGGIQHSVISSYHQKNHPFDGEKHETSRGIAMGQADEAVKQCAYDVCEEIDRDGILHALQRCGLCGE